MTSLDTFNQLAKWIGYVQTVRLFLIEAECNNVLCERLSACHSYSYFQHATADVSLMLVASKSDLERKREVTREDGTKVTLILFCWLCDVLFF